MGPAIKDLKAYVPARDFEMSKRFYLALGFRMTPGWGKTCDFELDGNQFRLQNYYVKEWAQNFMIMMGVHDVDAWYTKAGQVLAEGDFGPARIQPPEAVGDSRVLHVWDPSGILLILVQ
ncbi:MAG: hypothetical protein V4510_04600 [bacterium]